MCFNSAGGGRSVNGKLLGMFAVSAMVCAPVAVLHAQASAAKGLPADFGQSVLPVLAKNCFSCHSEKLATANLNLEAFRNSNLAPQRPEVWEKVLDKLRSAKMPPPPMPAPSKAEVTAVTSWVEALLGTPAPAANPDPGRVTARRLNRVEYDNTIRDLLGVSVRPAEEFPTDDSGYGFDNIGDVLSVSPLLLEKYLNAARTVSRAAVFGESYQPKPALLAKLTPKKAQDDSPATGNVLPFSMRGALYGSFHFPVTADYEFQLRFANYRPDVAVRSAGRPRTGGARRPPTAENRAARDES
ncbi:MAG: hypothetical protein C5B51_17615, partial [Terriglobia bacterium]